MLVVLAKHQGAQIRQEIVAEEHVAREVGTEQVTGSSERDPHKPRGGALAHKQIQRRAEQAQRRNAQDVVKELRTLEASFRPRVVVLAGEVQDRTAVHDALPEAAACGFAWGRRCEPGEDEQTAPATSGKRAQRALTSDAERMRELNLK